MKQITVSCEDSIGEVLALELARLAVQCLPPRPGHSLLGARAWRGGKHYQASFVSNDTHRVHVHEVQPEAL